MATKRVEHVLNGIKNLTPKERAELALILSKEDSQGSRTEVITESFSNINAIRTAPVDHGACTCCGK